MCIFASNKHQSNITIMAIIGERNGSPIYDYEEGRGKEISEKMSLTDVIIPPPPSGGPVIALDIELTYRKDNWGEESHEIHEIRWGGEEVCTAFVLAGHSENEINLAIERRVYGY
jgi:hypothetical protein